MIKTTVIFPDGTELSSGDSNAAAVIQSVKITDSVNDGKELTLGSVCSSMIELKILVKDADISLAVDQELDVYQDGKLVGTYIAEQPTWSKARIMTVTAYDRITLLDKDLSNWLAALDGWPYSLYSLAQLVCEECGLALLNEELPNGSFPVQAFSGSGITGRKLMRWIGEAAGRFCRATPEGNIEFSWYQPVSQLWIGPNEESGYDAIPWEYADGVLTGTAQEVSGEDGTLTISDPEILARQDGTLLYLSGEPWKQYYYFQGSCTREDYQVAAIEKVQIGQTDKDVGTIYPDDTEAMNTYRITGNPLLVALTASTLEPVAQILYTHLSAMTPYTPGKVTVLAESGIRAGDIVQVTDINGVTVNLYVMTSKLSGQKLTLECVGSATRDSVSRVNNQSLKALSGKVLNLETSVDGLRVENADAAGNLAALELNIQGISAQVSRQTEELGGVKTQLTEISQNADSIRLSVKAIQDNGADQVTTATGYTFNADGLRIQKEGQQMENLLDNTGMYVTRSGETVLQANDKGVIAADVSVRNFLIVGDNSRFEDYSDGSDTKRTACFYIGG